MLQEICGKISPTGVKISNMVWGGLMYMVHWHHHHPNHMGTSPSPPTCSNLFTWEPLSFWDFGTPPNWTCSNLLTWELSVTPPPDLFKLVHLIGWRLAFHWKAFLLSLLLPPRPVQTCSLDRLVVGLPLKGFLVVFTFTAIFHYHLQR